MGKIQIMAGKRKSSAKYRAVPLEEIAGKTSDRMAESAACTDATEASKQRREPDLAWDTYSRVPTHKPVVSALLYAELWTKFRQRAGRGRAAGLAADRHDHGGPGVSLDA